jgi:DNA-binding NtrC family response regulator
MVRVRLQAARFARSAAPILITGESGTGKELAARYIHQTSPRADQPFVPFNCAALPETLVESELFGHERGAFTGANDTHVGWFERAAGGTLVLDEISEIPLSIQAKLLRVLEQEEFQRIGGQQPLPMRARVLATSNRDLQKEVARGRFREDLYYRLNVLEIQLPALRRRREDIPALVDHFLEKFRGEANLPLQGIHPDAMQWLCEYAWPGNVRQLRNVIRRACIVVESPTITTRDVSLLIDPSGAEASDGPPQPNWYSLTLRDAERLLILAALRRHSGNRTAAARDLGVTPRTLHNRLKQDPILRARWIASGNAVDPSDMLPSADAA